jgi:hypothetical protein
VLYRVLTREACCDATPGREWQAVEPARYAEAAPLSGLYHSIYGTEG